MVNQGAHLFSFSALFFLPPANMASCPFGILSDYIGLRCLPPCSAPNSRWTLLLWEMLNVRTAIKVNSLPRLLRFLVQLPRALGQWAFLQCTESTWLVAMVRQSGYGFSRLITGDIYVPSLYQILSMFLY